MAGTTWFLIASTLAGLVSDEPLPSREMGEETFVRRVQPLLESRCVPCHGSDPKDPKGGLDARSLAGLMRGGDSETPAIEPGAPERSPLYLAAARTDDEWPAMPPKESDRIGPVDLEALKLWITAGAPWPSEARIRELRESRGKVWDAEDGVVVPTSGGLSKSWNERRYAVEGLWAYRPVASPKLDRPSGRSSIDALVALRLPAGLVPSGMADRFTLIRRASFDLLGLPPRPDQISEFLADPRPDDIAFAALVDRLLASPHYGERMARHWLDVVRYADSSGFANDYERGNAWRYRDYLIRSFNRDVPYDRMIRDQIAGDEIDPNDPERLIAVGYLRMGPWELTGMEVARVARARFLDDVVNSVGETFLAHSLQCARCHDHKFDPIPTRDYYAIRAVFATTQLAERPAPFLPEENRSRFEERAFLEASRDHHRETLRKLDARALEAAERWFVERKLDATAWEAAVDRASRSKEAGIFNRARTHLIAQGISEDRIPPRMLGWSPTEIGLERIARKGLERVAWELDRYEPVALSVYSGRTPKLRSVTAPLRIPTDPASGELEETRILTGGDVFAKGDPVTPGALSALPALGEARIPDTLGGRRRALADWIADPRNPLTTRAMVNRVWLWHFGRPIAGNPNNFGSTGKRPTHPELLDHLAAEFVRSGWSIKHLHRLIMNSDVYQRSGRAVDRSLLARLDPQGDSYAVFPKRRLSAEELRDAMLAVSGELDRSLGGIPIQPEIHPEAALQPRQVMGTFAEAWAPSPKPSDRHRRSIYVRTLRGAAHPMLETLNAPSPDLSCERRETSTVTPQALTLFNGGESRGRALAMAARVSRETIDDRRAIELCFRASLGREPTPTELEACDRLRRDLEVIEQSSAPPAPRARPPVSIERDAVEENTGERFRYVEPIPAAASFVPDLDPADVDPRTRILADICLVLFNSNEFAYVH
ncbi:MAG: PSD1 and planctomycete cytochrome C domain-containing protein [Isosphaeraceae bacterium]|nr:PSD1 and planctomycete cytochrome C domain-containing protein [Isosphaeraceae bacterium]